MIKRIKITNWKSLGDVDVSLDPVTVLIGQSGSGKTNLVDALRFIRDYVTQGNDGFLSKGPYLGWHQLVSATAAKPLRLRFSLAFDAPGMLEGYAYTLVFEQSSKAGHQSDNFYNPVLSEEKLSLGKKLLFRHTRAKNAWLQAPALENPPRPSGVMLGALSGLPEITTAFLVLSKGLGCYSFLDTVLLQPTQKAQTDGGLADAGENFLATYAGITNNLRDWNHPKEIVAALRRMNPTVKAIDLERPSLSRIVVSHEVDGKVLTFDLAQESGGFRRFLAHLLALYQTPPKQTLVFEEPEKGIHPGALATLVDNFKACPESGRGQVILTTHSPQLLDHFEPEQLRVVEMKDYVTTIGPVAAEQVEAIREKLLNPGDLLTVDPARVQPVQA